MAIKLNVPFSFMVDGREMAPGRYEFRLDGPDQAVLAIVDAKGGKPTAFPSATRLADLGSSEVQVIFDVSDGKHYLAEIHVPGADGYAFTGAPGKHSHEKVTGQ